MAGQINFLSVHNKKKKPIYLYSHHCLKMMVQSIMVRLFVDGPGDRATIPGGVIPNTQKKPPCLTFSIINYESNVNRAIQRKGWLPSLHIDVAAIEKGSYGSPSNTVFQLTLYIYWMFNYCCNTEKANWMRNNQTGSWNGNLYHIKKIQYSPAAWRR